jgi:hypothetical protein
MDFDLLVSEFVIGECADGDPVAAAERIRFIRGIPVIPRFPEQEAFTAGLIDFVPFPPNAKTDALHLATAVLAGANYLLTWNCRHLSNAALFGRMTTVCRDFGFELPVICTPDQLLKDVTRAR